MKEILSIQVLASVSQLWAQWQTLSLCDQLAEPMIRSQGARQSGLSAPLPEMPPHP